MYPTRNVFFPPAAAFRGSAARTSRLTGMRALPRSLSGAVFACVLAGCLSTATAATPQPGERLACQTWFDRTFARRGTNEAAACLKILYEDVPEGVTRGHSWRGTPYQLGDRTYAHGLAFNSTKHILV